MEKFFGSISLVIGLWMGVLFVDFHHKARRSPFKFISCESWQQTAMNSEHRTVIRRRRFEKLGKRNANKHHPENILVKYNFICSFDLFAEVI